ncbi:uncharacterized protein M437DRAFT_62437 [Aureobasidium melanogenum CBS 110374]|uniref:Uncharacterized protein n=1 Tax=Aureobasidium melanogenum (strain CBS 110374) TaxID=1043003 RepID=A0A074WV10_AURM1|nr:uncharacterized protein M437DRAFT_62437 [Aureobasidium melanogenum CBS 110374]KEQ66211.1 hypothetical protein M437DRAFT_62437 [Aureobasidium melanogenum CBS 110374]
MNTPMHQTARCLPRSFVNGLSLIRREFSVSSPLVSYSNNPVKRAEQREYIRAWLNRRRKEDEAWREAELKRNAAYNQKVNADPVWREARKELKRVHGRQRYQDKQVSGRMRFRYWLTHGSKKLREGLIWKTHVPILYKDKVKHTCVGCGYPPWGGLKLWCEYCKSVPERDQETS